MAGDRSPAHSTDAPYLVVEKILSGDEALPADWPVHGTTGYNFLNLLGGLLVHGPGVKQVREVYHRFTDNEAPFWRIVYDAKQLILGTSLSSEFYGLANQLDRIAQQHRWSRDFTRPSLYRALREVVSCFPVYRTYIRPDSDSVSDVDRRRIREAARLAKRRNPAMSPTFFDFIASILLLEDPVGLSEADREYRRRFVLKFQQITGPVTAKGLEDTTFYRYYPLVSLAEVGGGDPAQAAMTPERWHAAIRSRRRDWPFEMSATATHDTKRGEDMRARLHVLSEAPAAWEAAIARWQAMNRGLCATVDETAAPDANEEYLYYQTLVGAWPLEPQDDAAWEKFVERLVRYMEKALREAKLHTSWLHPDSEHEDAVFAFIRKSLADRKSEFVQDVERFVRSIADAGFVNSLAQTTIKLFAPGVPDFYQGVEFWDFRLVDPDNRQPVDFAARREALTRLRRHAREDLAATAAALVDRWPGEEIKLFVTSRGLEYRRDHREILTADYEPLAISGSREANAFAFARIADGRWLVVVTPRLALEAWQAAPPSGLVRESKQGAVGWPPSAWWTDTAVTLPPGAPRRWQNIFTGRSIEATGAGGPSRLAVDQMLRDFPVAVLVADAGSRE